MWDPLISIFFLYRRSKRHYKSTVHFVVLVCPAIHNVYGE